MIDLHMLRKLWTYQLNLQVPRWQGMSFLSATLTEWSALESSVMDQQKRLVFRATKDEMIFEAATQLGLLMQIFMSSGIGSSAS